MLSLRDSLRLQSSPTTENTTQTMDATHLPATTRHYPAQEAPGRPDIWQIHAGDKKKGILKPDRSHRSSKSSTSTLVTSVSSGGYPGLHTGLGTPMPWMNLHARRMHDK